MPAIRILTAPRICKQCLGKFNRRDNESVANYEGRDFCSRTCSGTFGNDLKYSIVKEGAEELWPSDMHFTDDEEGAMKDRFVYVTYGNRSSSYETNRFAASSYTPEDLLGL